MLQDQSVILAASLVNTNSMKLYVLFKALKPIKMTSQSMPNLSPPEKQVAL